MKGFDCATPLTAETAAAFAADGYGFVARYTVPEGSWKALTAKEVKAIVKAGLYIVSVFETTADRALDGAEAGSYDGQVAVDIVKALGQPVGTPIYFAIDFDVDGNQFDAVAEYLQAAKEVLAQEGYLIGDYGSFSLVETMDSRGITGYHWQTLAWSHGRRSDKAQLYQSDIDQTENGIGVDHNESNGSAGGWQPGNVAAPTTIVQTVEVQVPVHTLTPDEANEIIGFLGAAWNMVTAEEDKTKIHNYANLMRKLSGQEEEL